MSGSKRSTFGQLGYGPFADGTVQTQFRFSKPHPSENGYHVDFELWKPALPKDIRLDKVHIKLRS